MRVSLRSLGWYHVAGAVAGGVGTVWAWSQGAALPGGSFATAAIPFALTWGAGIGLLRGHAAARRLGYLAQAIQIPILIAPVAAWKFIAGLIASITLTTAGVGLYAGFELTWLIGTGPTDPFPVTVGLNLVPVVILVLLVRARPTSGSHETVSASRPAA